MTTGQRQIARRQQAPKAQLVYDDGLGDKVYITVSGDLVNKHGDLLGLEHEGNIRTFLSK